MESNNIKRFSENSTTKRIAKLRKNLLSTKIEIDIERAQLLTEFWKESENLPLIIRKAKALKHILNNMTIYINES